MALIAPFTKENLRRSDRLAVRVARAAAQTIPDGIITPVEFDSQTYSTGTGLWTAGAPSLVSVTEGGVYVITAAVQWDYPVGGGLRRWCGVYDTAVGGLWGVSETTGSIATCAPTCAVAVECLVTSARSFVLYAFQTSGGVDDDILGARMEVVRVR
jgi:hypothetical protein